MLAKLDEKESKQSTVKITKKYEDYSAGIIFDNGEIDDEDKNRFIPKETSLQYIKMVIKVAKHTVQAILNPENLQNYYYKNK